MGSLFTKIFISFWLAALLLVLSFAVLQSLYGGDTVREARQRLQDKAETVATLWNEDRPMILRRWLQQQPKELRLFLVDDEGHPILQDDLPPSLRKWLPREIEEDTYRLARGHIVITTPVSVRGEHDDALFLLTVVHRGHIQNLPLWLRITLAGLIIGLVSFGLSALLTRRLGRLRHAAQAMADGNLNVRIDASGRDEVAALSRDFDLMAERLQDMLESQRRLLSDVSHELRSPLARMRVALEISEQDSDYAKALGRITKEADELEMLITHVLSLARLESGNARLNRQPLELNEVISQIVKDADFEAQTQKRSVSLDIEGKDFTMSGDPVLLKSAIENIVRNALRYTPEGSSVEVSLARQKEQFMIQVRDHGPGIPETQLGNIFKPFVRASEARDRDSGGYGLGLAIAAGAVRAHSGTTRAENAQGGGLVVRITLPIE